jgi:electron transfer flavoprotein alpha/beta subunit
MMWERNRAESGRRLERLEQVLRVGLPVLLTVAGLTYVWRLNQARQVRTRDRLYRNAVSGPVEALPHFDPGEDAVETASEDSFPASDPPAYTAQDRMGTPAR